MADVAKFAPVNGGNLISHFKSHFSILKTRKTITLAYVFIFVFIAFTIFLAFTPSSNSSALWFTSIFTLPSTTNSSSLSSPIDQSYGSRFYGYLFPNSSSLKQSQNSSLAQNAGSSNTSFSMKNFTKSEDPPHKVEVLKQNNTQIGDKVEVLKENSTGIQDKLEVLKENSTRIQDKVEVLKSNQSLIANSTVDLKNASSTNGEKDVVVEKGSFKNLTSSLMKKQSNGTNGAASKKKGEDDLINSLMNCDFYDGNWMRDDSYPLYKPGSCSLIDEQFNCFLNGRPDNGYFKLKWKPKGCTLPRYFDEF